MAGDDVVEDDVAGVVGLDCGLFDRLMTIPFLGGEVSGVAGGERAVGSVGGSLVAVAGGCDADAGAGCAGGLCGVDLLGVGGLRTTFAGDAAGEEDCCAGEAGRGADMLFMFDKLGRLNVEFRMSSSSVRSITGLTSSWIFRVFSINTSKSLRGTITCKIFACGLHVSQSSAWWAMQATCWGEQEHIIDDKKQS